MKKTTVKCVDLFAGGGGTSSGAKQACARLGYDLQLTAINHWDLAIATHSANHKQAKHICADIESVRPREVVPGGHLQLLTASPSCVHFSVARGGKPVNEQERAGARYVVDWAESLYIENILLENVREFTSWGPVETNPRSKHFGKPIPDKRGQFFIRFVDDLKLLGYIVEWRILNAADYGAPTTRERFFLQAKKKKRGARVEITWPEPTHCRPGREGQRTLFEAGSSLKPWRAAREIIDWGIKNPSIFERKKPLAPNTMRRIMAGFEKWGKAGEPFLVVLRNHMDAQSVDDPIPTITAGGGHLGVAETSIEEVGPFMLGQQSGSAARSVDEPIPTVATDGAISLVEPFIVTAAYGAKKGESQSRRVLPIDSPLGTLTGSNTYGVVEANVEQVDGFVFPHQRKQNATNLDQPLPTVTATSSDFAIVESFLTPLNHGKDDHRIYSVDSPMPTQTSADTMSLVDGFITPFFGENASQKPRSHSLNDPLPTVTSHGAGGLVEAFITTAGGTEGQGRTAKGVDEPLGTILTNDRRALVEAFIAPTNHGTSDRSYSIDKPMPTITTVDGLGFVEGVAREADERDFLVKFYGAGKSAEVDQPLDTVTTKDRFGLVKGKGYLVETAEGKRYLVDIRFRMLQPHELAGGQSFEPGYQFVGNREQVVKQIGNAVCPALAEALIAEILKPKRRAGRIDEKEIAA